jgi:hypothetical protein
VPPGYRLVFDDDPAWFDEDRCLHFRLPPTAVGADFVFVQVHETLVVSRVVMERVMAARHCSIDTRQERPARGNQAVELMRTCRPSKSRDD